VKTRSEGAEDNQRQDDEPTNDGEDRGELEHKGGADKGAYFTPTRATPGSDPIGHQANQPGRAEAGYRQGYDHHDPSEELGYSCREGHEKDDRERDHKPHPGAEQQAAPGVLLQVLRGGRNTAREKQPVGGEQAGKRRAYE
jgi:hypothetical protein